MLKSLRKCALALGVGLALAGCGGGGGGGGGGSSSGTPTAPALTPTAFFADNFDRADAAIGATVTETHGALLYNYLTNIPGGSSMAIVSNQVALDGSNGSPTAIYGRDLPVSFIRIELDFSFTGSFLTDGGNMVILRSSGVANPTDFFACMARQGSTTAVSQLALVEIISGTPNDIAAGTTDYPMGGANAYSFRFTAEDSGAGATFTCELLNSGGTVLESLTGLRSVSSGNRYAGFKGGDSTGTLRYDNLVISSHSTDYGGSLEGTWISCFVHYTGTHDVKQTYTFADNTLAMSGADYTGTTNGSCGGSASGAYTATGTLAYSHRAISAGWTNRTITVSPPDEVGGGGPLPGTWDLVVLNVTGTMDGTPFADIPLEAMGIDNSGTPNRLYRTNRNPWNPCSSDETSGGDQRCLSTTDYFVKQ